MTNKVKQLSKDEFNNLTILDPDVIYFVDDETIYTNYNGEKKDILKYVKVNYYCNNNNMIIEPMYSKKYISGEKIELPIKYDLNISSNYNENTYNEYLFFEKWLCDNEEVNNFAPFSNKNYYTNPYKIKISNYSIINQINTYNQSVDLPIKIQSDIPVYLKTEFLDQYYLTPHLIKSNNGLSNFQYDNVVNYTINPIDKISSSKELIFNVTLYKDVNCIKKLLDLNIKVLINVSNESSGD